MLYYVERGRPRPAFNERLFAAGRGRPAAMNTKAVL